MVKYISDRIAVMHFGKIVELGTSDEIYYHPLHDYTKSLLSAIPQPDPDSERTRKRIVYEEDESAKMQNVDCKKLRKGGQDLIITFCNR